MGIKRAKWDSDFTDTLLGPRGARKNYEEGKKTVLNRMTAFIHVTRLSVKEGAIIFDALPIKKNWNGGCRASA